ncbi:MAG TPA: 30S ribosomal protein S17 [Candidatus Azoamicus sp. MARI]
MNVPNLIGVVFSKKMDKTVIVKITKMVKHKKYQKYIKRTTKYFVHDANNSCSEGDIINFKKTAPISKKKHWAIISKIKKG